MHRHQEVTTAYKGVIQAFKSNSHHPTLYPNINKPQGEFYASHSVPCKQTCSLSPALMDRWRIKQLDPWPFSGARTAMAFPKIASDTYMQLLPSVSTRKNLYKDLIAHTHSQVPDEEKQHPATRYTTRKANTITSTNVTD